MLGKMRKNTYSKWSAAQDEGKVSLWISKSSIVRVYSLFLFVNGLYFLKTELFDNVTIFPWVSFLELKAPALPLAFLRLRRDNLSLCSPFTGEVLSLLIPVSIPSYSSSTRRGQAVTRPLSRSRPWLRDIASAASWLPAGVKSKGFSVLSTGSVLQVAELLSCADECRAPEPAACGNSWSPPVYLPADLRYPCLLGKESLFGAPCPSLPHTPEALQLWQWVQVRVRRTRVVRQGGDGRAKSNRAVIAVAVQERTSNAFSPGAKFPQDFFFSFWSFRAAWDISQQGKEQKREKKVVMFDRKSCPLLRWCYSFFLLLCVFIFKRTKKIRNKAVVNASPAEKLIRELKAENNKLLSRLAGLGSTGRSIADETRMYFSINE